jgi:heat shock protein HslJ
MNVSTLLMIMLAVATTFTACVSMASQPESATAVTSTTQAAGNPVLGLWVLGSASNISTVPGGITLSIRRNGALNTGSLHIGGFSGINYYVSDALIDGSQQRFILSSKLASTERHGPQQDVVFEKAYLDELDGVVEYHLSSADDMTLTTIKGDTLKFHKISN